MINAPGARDRVVTTCEKAGAAPDRPASRRCKALIRMFRCGAPSHDTARRVLLVPHTVNRSGARPFTAAARVAASAAALICTGDDVTVPSTQ